MAKKKVQPKPKRRRIHFQHTDKRAEKVYLVGDFNGWDPKSRPMKKNEDGTWGRTILVAPGRYEYKFLVDGVWKEDTSNHERCANSFGTLNCIVQIE